MEAHTSLKFTLSTSKDRSRKICVVVGSIKIIFLAKNSVSSLLLSMENSYQPRQRTQASPRTPAIPWVNSTREHTHRWRLSYEIGRSSSFGPSQLANCPITREHHPNKGKRGAVQPLHLEMSFSQKDANSVLRSL